MISPQRRRRATAASRSNGIGVRRWLLVAPLLVSGCMAGDPAIAPAPGSEMALLRRAPKCAAFLPPFGYINDSFYPANGDMQIGNDGGWCWVDMIFTPTGSYSRNDDSVPTVAQTRLATPPAHGEVKIGTFGDTVRYAYRPSPGYIGKDRFVVYAVTPNHDFDVPLSITVSPP